jgi:hypothetical protein
MLKASQHIQIADCNKPRKDYPSVLSRHTKEPARKRFVKGYGNTKAKTIERRAAPRF